MSCARAVAAVWAALLACGVAHAQSIPLPDEGKLLATGGVSTIEGAGGGGLTPWALISGYGSRDSYGINAHYTYVTTQDYSLFSPGVSVGVFDRFEFSYANQRFTGTDKALNDVSIRQDIYGLKVRVLGDAVYGQDSWVPQVAVGLEYKQNQGIRGLEGLGVHNPTDLGAKSNSGVDVYVAATKLFLAQSILVNLTLRDTEANQFGLLGFGGNLHSSRSIVPEASIAYLVNRKLAVGAEYRDKPHNLAIDDEAAAYDVFVAYFPTRNISVTAAYVNLGTIVKPFNGATQSGPYLSLQVGF